MSWLTGWLYRKQHVINSASGAGTDYQIKLVVRYGNGTDSGTDVYCNSKCKTDFGDLRFAASDGSTLLDYWMESKTDSNNAVFWVKISEDLGTANRTICVYYGNSNAATTSNGANTFAFFDDFSSQTGWTFSGGTTGITGGNLFVNSISSQSSYAYKTRPDGYDNYRFRFRESFGPTMNAGFRAQPRAVTPLTMNNPIFMSRDYYYNPVNNVRFTTQGGVALPALGPSRDTNWHNIEILKYGSTYINYYDSISSSGTDATPETGTYIQFGVEINGGNLNVDWVFLSKFVNPEPAQGTWGAEENPPYIINSSADSTSTITPSGTTYVTAGNSQTYSVSPSTGYHITHVYVDDVDQGAITSYTFSNVGADHTISVTSAINTYTITASAGSGGTISPSGAVSVDYNADQAFTMMADANHQILSVTVDGLAQGDISNYMFNDVQADHVISVTFTSSGIPSEGITMNGPLSYDLTTGEAISANHIVSMSNNGTIVTATRSNAQHQVGVAVEDISSGNQGVIAFSGPVQICAGMNLTPGMHVTTDDLGRAYQYAGHTHDKGTFEFSSENNHTHVIQHQHTGSVTIDSESPTISSENSHTHAITHGSIQVTDGNGDTHSHYYASSPTQAGSSHTHTVTHAHTGSVSIDSESPETTNNSGHTHTIASGLAGNATDEKPIGLVVVGASTGNLATVILGM